MSSATETGVEVERERGNWLAAVGFPSSPSLPNLGLVGHVIYGAVLGAVYPVFSRRF